MNTLKKIILLLLLLSIPFLVITSAIRLALTPFFINLEYRLPGFPEDPYGFTLTDRLYWSHYAINYLSGRISHAQLVSQRLPDGSPLFNQRELIHMLDVMILTRLVIRIWLGLLVFFIGILFLGKKLGWKDDWLKTLEYGGYLTIGLIAAILIYVWLDFNQLFTRFHQIFFEGDSWLFWPSDNLIRLFPLRFWMDLFIFIGALSLAFSLLLIVLAKRSGKR